MGRGGAGGAPPGIAPRPRRKSGQGEGADASEWSSPSPELSPTVSRLPLPGTRSLASLFQLVQVAATDAKARKREHLRLFEFGKEGLLPLLPLRNAETRETDTEPPSRNPMALRRRGAAVPGETSPGATTAAAKAVAEGSGRVATATATCGHRHHHHRAFTSHPPSDLTAAIHLLAARQHQGNLLLHDIALQLRIHGARLAAIEAAVVGAWRAVRRRAERAAAAALAADLRAWLAAGRAAASLALLLAVFLISIKQQQQQQLKPRRLWWWPRPPSAVHRRRLLWPLLLAPRSPSALLLGAARRWAAAVVGWVLLATWASWAWRRWWCGHGGRRRKEAEDGSGSEIANPVARALVLPAALALARRQGEQQRFLHLVTLTPATAVALADELVIVIAEAVVGGLGAFLALFGGRGVGAASSAAVSPSEAALVWSLAYACVWFPFSVVAWHRSNGSNGVRVVEALAWSMAAHLGLPAAIAAAAAAAAATAARG